MLSEFAAFTKAASIEKKPTVHDEDNTASMYRDPVGWTIHRKRAWTALLNGAHYDYIDFSIMPYVETGTPGSQRGIRSPMGYLAHFIQIVRSLPADPIIVRQNWLEAYNFTTTSGSQALNDYARANDPFAKLGKQQLAIDVSSVIRASSNSFRVEWIERHYSNNALASTERWSAILSIVVQIPTDADRLKRNPLGVYVNAINWSKELG